MSLSSSTVDVSATVVVVVDSCEISVVFRLGLNSFLFPLPINSVGILSPVSLVSVSLVLWVQLAFKEVASDFEGVVLDVFWKISRSS